MNGDAEIITNQKENVLTIPLSSIVDDEYVYVKINPDRIGTSSRFEKRNVKTGLSNETDIEIKSGLKLGEEVAIDPTEAEKRVKK
jgi:HlyD family secretion protein